MRWLILLFLVTLAFQKTAVSKDTDTSRVKQLHQAFQQQLKNGGGEGLADLKRQASLLSEEQFRTILMQEKQRQLEVEDEQFDLRHRHRSFDFQYTASVVIFIIVILVVLTGLVFAGIQFRFALKQMQLRHKLLDVVKESSEALPDQLKTELQFSKEGVKVNSSVLGVVILVFSMAFFYMYLIYVYPIKYITPQDSARITHAAPEQPSTADSAISGHNKRAKK